MRSIFLLSSFCLLSTAVGFCASPDLAGVSAPLAITQTTQIPGEVLKPGEYSISIVDQLADRMIVRIDSKSNPHPAVFLGVQGSGAGSVDGSGPVLWSTGLHKAAALRGFNFAGGKRVEFVYPKAEAAALAKENSAKVVAVDPESEGHSATLKNLSQDELKMVNLWMLSLTTTGLDQKTPAVLAERYEAPVEAAPVVAAKAAAAPLPQVASIQEPMTSQAVATQRGAPSRPAQRRAVIAQLPHTASDLPVVWVVGLMAMLGAAILRVVRGSIGQRKLA